MFFRSFSQIKCKIQAGWAIVWFCRGALRGISRGGFIPKQSGLAVNDFGDNSLFNRDNKDYAPPSSGIRGFGRGAGASFGRGGEVGSGNFVPSAQEDNHASLLGNLSVVETLVHLLKAEIMFLCLLRVSSVFSSRGGQGGNRSRGGAFGSSINNEDFSSGYGSSFGKQNQFSSNEDTRGGNRFQDTGEGRPPPRNFAPPARRVDDLFKEDADHAESYALIADDDGVTVSGANIEHTAIIVEDAGFQPKLFFNIVERAKYIRPRKIQAMTIPFIMDGRDVKGHAETGSGRLQRFCCQLSIRS
uniref:RNA helicase n=1 Tax=Ditylenchus dipsaci TaxID=166011 RepID=A0A915E5A0_9BILA